MNETEMESTAYTLNDAGRITNPGRFEGEAAYVPYFWKISLDGGADRDDGKILGFDVTAEDRRRWPALKGRHTVKLYQTDDGFICEVR